MNIKNILVVVFGSLVILIMNLVIAIKKIYKIVKKTSKYKQFCKFVYELNKSFLDKKYREMFRGRFDNKSDSILEMILYRLSETFIIDYEENEYDETHHEVKSLLFEFFIFIYHCFTIWLNNIDKIIWDIQ